MTFKSTRIRRMQGTEYKDYGDLTINSVTKPVVLNLKHEGTIVGSLDGITKSGFKLTSIINRYDFGLKWNIAKAAESFAVIEEIKLNCNVRLTMVVEAQETN
jgi:polyisoprenoid-binding protein YceI